MKPYHNLFYPFSQRENQATKALLNVLEFIHPKYTKQFIEYLIEDEINALDFQYTLQGIPEGRNLKNQAAKNYLLCIAESTKPNNDSSEKITSIPDGGIFSRENLDKPINIVIETKVGKSELSMDQINRHCSLFGVNGPKVLYKTWEDVRAFFRGIMIEDKDVLTQKVVHHFEQFCVVYNLGKNKRNRDFWFIQFHAYYDIACKIDDLLLKSLGYPVYEQEARDNGISYNKDEKRKTKRFAKLHVSGNEYILMLTFGSKNEKLADAIRTKYNLDIVRGKKGTIKGYQATHEVWIPLEQIVDGTVSMCRVKELCIEAYKKTYVK